MSNSNSSESEMTGYSDFYDLAAKFAEETSTSEHPHRLLKLWAHRFPEHAADLAAIAYARLIEPDAPGRVATPVDEQSIMLSAQRVLERLTSAKKPLTSLTAEASKSGVNHLAFVEILRIDIPLLAKLEQRLLQVKTIPSTLIETIASTIGRTSSEVVAYLSGSPQLASSAHYKSNQPPTVGEGDKQTFGDALKSSPKISSENRKYWQDQIRQTEHHN